MRYWVEALKLAVQFAFHHEAKPSAPRRGSLPAPFGSPLVAKRLCRGALARHCVAGPCTRLCHGPAPLVGRASAWYPSVPVSSCLGDAPVSVTVRRRSRGGGASVRYPSSVPVLSCLGGAPVSVTVRRRSRGGPRCGPPRNPSSVLFGSVRFGQSPPAGSGPVLSSVLSLPRGVLALSGAPSYTILIQPNTGTSDTLSPARETEGGSFRMVCRSALVLICLSRRVAETDR